MTLTEEIEFTLGRIKTLTAMSQTAPLPDDRIKLDRLHNQLFKLKQQARKEEVEFSQSQRTKKVDHYSMLSKGPDTE